MINDENGRLVMPPLLMLSGVLDGLLQIKIMRMLEWLYVIRQTSLKIYDVAALSQPDESFLRNILTILLNKYISHFNFALTFPSP